MPAFIEAVELRKTYRVGKIDVPALRGISFNVEKGEFVSVVGPSGSGKSTLFYLLGGLTRADSGHVVIDGNDPGDRGHNFLLAWWRAALVVMKCSRSKSLGQIAAGCRGWPRWELRRRSSRPR